MRLLFAIKSLNVPGGGAERVLVQVASGLVARGHDVAVMTFDSPGLSFYPLDERVRRIDLAVGPPGQPTPRFGLLAALPRMRSAAVAFRPDLAVGFMHSMYLPLGIALVASGVPVVASEHALSRHFQGRAVQRAMVNLGKSLFVAKTVPSGSVRREHDEAARKRVFVLPNPLDLESLSGIEHMAPASPPVLLSVGRFMVEKNQKDLVEAFGRIAGEFPDWSLRLVGEGELRAELEEQVRRTPHGDRIALPGATRDIAGEYRQASIVVVPSRFESFGMVTAEAQACGRPVLGFADCPGTNELIVDGVTGLLVPGGESRVQGLAEGLRRLMADPALRAQLGAAGPASVQRFSIGSVVDAWESFMSRAVSSRLYAEATSP